MRRLNLALAVEIGRVLRVFSSVERGFLTEGPGPLLARLRGKGRLAQPRDAASRERLQRAIRWVDACVPTGRSCYRRALLEIALDPFAAEEKLIIGLDVSGDSAAGHTWLGEDSVRLRMRPYDVELDV